MSGCYLATLIPTTRLGWTLTSKLRRLLAAQLQCVLENDYLVYRCSESWGRAEKTDLSSRRESSIIFCQPAPPC